MYSDRQLFRMFLAQTSDAPMELEVVDAQGIYLIDPEGRKYMDLISGVNVNASGHAREKVVEAVKKQVDRYMHTMVYGEFIQGPQVQYARKLCEALGDGFDNVYFVNSGSEAIEGAMKLAKRYTRRTGIISFKNAYHGGTHGALSILGNEEYKNAFRPLLPEISILDFNSIPDLKRINSSTAAVIVEPVQAEAGVVWPDEDFLFQLRKSCDRAGSLLIFDEIQTSFGRLGSLFGFQRFGIKPDIIVLAKAFGGGMPLGAFVTEKKVMQTLATSPVLGHITTFGGHPVSCAAGLAAFEDLLENKWWERSAEIGEKFRQDLKHNSIREIRGEGSLLAVQLKDGDTNMAVVRDALKRGLILDWFLFDDSSFRISPPFIITDDEIRKACRILTDTLDDHL
jgi:acetylornithine/succinyldiaminopimelate/putrescine aminotransferase